MNKKKLLIIFAIVVIFIVVGIIGILYFTTDMFKSNEALFWKYFAKASDIYQVLLDDKLVMQQEFKQNNSYISDGNLSLTITQGENSVKKLDLKTATRHSANTNRTLSNISLMNGELDIFNVSYINSDDIYAIKCDEVTPIYIGFRNSNINELMAKYDIDTNLDILEIGNFSTILSVLSLDENQKEHLKDTYLPIILKNIPENQYTLSKQQISIDDTIYVTNEYKVNITSDNIKQIFLDILNALKLDNDTLLMLSNKFLDLQLGEDYTDTEKLKTKITSIIEKVEQTDMQNDIYIYVYEKDGQTIETKIEISDLFTLIYDNATGKKSIIIELKNNNAIYSNENNAIIDLNKYEENIKEEYTVTRIEIEKEITNNNMITFRLIPDINEEQNIIVQVNLSNIQNNSFVNSMIATINMSDEEKSKTIQISYDTSTTKTNEIEEIEELTDANTVIANNYSKEKFVPFITKWNELFANKINEKLEILGFTNF